VLSLGFQAGALAVFIRWRVAADAAPDQARAAADFYLGNSGWRRRCGVGPMGSALPPAGLQHRGEEGAVNPSLCVSSRAQGGAERGGESWPSLGLRGRRFLFGFVAGGERGRRRWPRLASYRVSVANAGIATPTNHIVAALTACAALTRAREGVGRR
jgi:hypothetical protein